MAKTKQPRIKKHKSYKSFRLSKRIKHPSKKKLPGIIKLVRLSLAPIGKNKKLFFGIILTQFLISILFVIGIDSIYSFLSTKRDILQGSGSGYAHSLALFGYVVSLGTSGAGSNLQFFIILIFSLAIIWSIRQVLAAEKIHFKQAFYEGMYPLIPFISVLFVIGLQLLPLTIGNFFLTTVISGGLAATTAEQVLWWALFGFLALLSLYMILSSIFALYIVTLPGMTPLKALRSARGLVLHRRLNIALRLAGLPVLGVFVYVAVLIPFILIVPVFAIPIFALLSSFGLFFVHSYIYNLYRELL